MTWDVTGMSFPVSPVQDAVLQAELVREKRAQQEADRIAEQARTRQAQLEKVATDDEVERLQMAQEQHQLQAKAQLRLQQLEKVLEEQTLQADADLAVQQRVDAQKLFFLGELSKLDVDITQVLARSETPFVGKGKERGKQASL